MRLRRILGAAAAAAMLVTGTAASASAHGSDRLGALRAATTKYHNISVAEQAGYGLLTDVNGIACITDDMDGMGAMGVHYANSDLVGDGQIRRFKPEALLYAPDRQGTLHLAGVEYVVLKDAWLAHHKHAPKLFGHTFNFTPAGNRFGLPDFYSLHVWAWKANPAGTFEMFNPKVHCPA